jgi:hypothetical protein
VRDDTQKIRANIIGTQHSVNPKDKNLNSKIVDAIKRSSKAILEIPPNSKLLPSISSSEWVIRREVESLNKNKIKNINQASLDEIEHVLGEIQRETEEQEYKKFLVALEEMPSHQDRLAFAQAIQQNVLEFNEVSLEENINKIILENGIETAPLEDIDLAGLLEQALKESVPKELPEADERKELRKQIVRNELYSAWVRGDALALRKLLDECHEELYKEPPEIAKIHDPRDENMAKRIAEVVVKAKEEDKEDLIVLGCAHLLYSKRKNVIEFLNERFKTDLKGWSITQVKD